MASNDDERRSTLPTSTVVTRQQSRERARAAFDAIPNDIIVSIFSRVIEEPDPPVVFTSLREGYDYVVRRSNDLRWVRETFPLVCRRWRDLYRSRRASPLHETLEIDFGDASREDSPPQIVRAENVISWARRHASDVRTLGVVGRLSEEPEDFTSEDLATLVEIASPSLTKIEIGYFLGKNVRSLARGPFWDALRDSVAPVGQLRKLAILGVDVDLAEGDDDDEDDDDVVDVSFFRQLTSLEKLSLLAETSHVGLRAFPASFLALTNLRRLELVTHSRITSLPAGISSLENLESFKVIRCSMRSLPEELGALKRLTELDLTWNSFGDTEVDVAFPTALRGMSALRRLGLRRCRLRDVPSFIGALESLEDLDLSENYELRDGGFPESFPTKLAALTELDLTACGLASVPPVVLSSTPKLVALSLAYNDRLVDLPDDLGKRLPELREIGLSGCSFAAFPLRALAGASSLEVIDVRFQVNSRFQVEEPLDALLENFPRLRVVHLQGREGHHSWTPTSRANLEAFASALRQRDPTALVSF